MTDEITSPTSLKNLLLGGMELFDAQVERVGETDLAAATPCAEWDVEALIRHTADSADRARARLTGQTWTPGEATQGPVDRWRTARDGLRSVLREAAVDETWPLPDDSPVAKVRFVGCDFAVHSWDLQVALDAEAELPVAWVEFMDRFFRSVAPEVLRSPGVFADPLTGSDDVGPTRALMAYLGRSPR